ncbi:MAG: hypothetical protein WB777_14270 [Mycobacterium sp.]
MSVTVSGWYGSTLHDLLFSAQLAVDLSVTTNKVALYTNSLTPNFALAGDTGYSASPYTSNEISGTGYTAGGAAVASPTLTENPTGTISWDIANTSWTTSTITNARAAYIYANALSAKNGIVLITFGADYSTSAGTFTIQWASAGVAGFTFHG